MVMGQRAIETDEPLWVSTTHLSDSPQHPFYEHLNELLRARGFDRFVEQLCHEFYSSTNGRPSVPPGVYFRCLIIGHFEAIDSANAIAWRCADSLSLRRFLGVRLDQPAPGHATICRTRQLIDTETHLQVSNWLFRVLGVRALGLARAPAWTG